MSVASPLQAAPAKAQASVASTANGLLQRKCACGSSKSPLGEMCDDCRSGNLQRKLAIGASNDPLEREADRIADQVMATPARPAVRAALPRIQRLPGQPAGQIDAAPVSVDQALASPGMPLGPVLQQDMEQRLGHDFSQVRVHTDAAAAQSARDVNAHAYTAGHNIVFGPGRFAPGTHQGRRLIAHELTHVMQQSETDRLPIGQSNKKCSPSLPADYSIARKPRTGVTDTPSSAVKTMGRAEAREVLAAYIATGGVDDTLAAMNAIEETLDTSSTPEKMRLRLLTAAFSLLDDRSAVIVYKALTTPVGAQQEHLHKRFLRIDSDFRRPLLEILRERAAAKAAPEAERPAAAPPTAKPTWIELHPGVFALVPDAGTTLDAIAAYVTGNPDVPAELARLNNLSRTTPIEAGRSIIIPVEFIQREKALQEMSEPMRRYIISTQVGEAENAQLRRFIQVRTSNRPGPGIGGSTLVAAKVAAKPIELTAAVIKRIVDGLISLIEKAAYAIAFAAGVIHGFLKSIGDAVSGIAKLIYEVLKSVFSDEFVSDIRSLASSVRKLSWDKIKHALGTWAAGWADKLESNNPLVAGHAHGYLTGYVMAEAAMLLLTGGTVAALKGAIWTSKLGKGARAIGEVLEGSRIFQTLETGIAKAAKVRRAAASEFDKAVDALRQSRLGGVVKAAEVTGAAVAWTASRVKTVLQLPGDIARYVVDKAVAHAKQLGPFFDRIGGLTDRAKRWLFGCRSPCDWEADAVANTMNKLTNEKIETAAKRAAASVPKSQVTKSHGDPAPLAAPPATVKQPKPEAPRTPPSTPVRIEELKQRRAANDKRIVEIESQARIHEERGRDYIKKSEGLLREGGPNAGERAAKARQQATNEARLRDENKAEIQRLQREINRISQEINPPPKPKIGPGPAQPHGGAHKGIPTAGGEGNHIPPESVMQITGKVTGGRGPAIWMEKADHLQTNSWGQRTFKPTRKYPYSSADEWRAAQAELIRKGRIQGAVQMDIDDIRSKFGSKYDKGIQEMLDYIKTLLPSEF